MNDRLAELFASLKSTSPAPKGPITHMVVGLGNPGKQYENTRHNVGFLALDKLAERHRIPITSSRFQALVGEGMIGDVHVLLMKPQTFMNLSGDAVKAAADYYKIPAENIIVFCDDISFDPGRVRIRKKGSAGGHNGLKSIIACLSSDAFVRFKLGVGERKDKTSDLADFVLSRFSSADRAALDALVARLPLAIEMWLSGKEEETLNQFSK